MVGWHGLEFEQALGVGDGQGSLVCCSPQGQTDSVTQQHGKRGALKRHLHTQVVKTSIISNNEVLASGNSRQGG